MNEMQTRDPTQLDPSHLIDVLDRNNDLIDICKKTKLIQQANDILTQKLAKPLNEHCQIANINLHSVTVTTDNAVWGNQLRYHQQEIASILREHAAFSQIEFVKIRLVPPQKAVQKPSKRLEIPEALSKASAESAEAVTHPLLKQALTRLGQKKVSDPN